MMPYQYFQELPMEREWEHEGERKKENVQLKFQRGKMLNAANVITKSLGNKRQKFQG